MYQVRLDRLPLPCVALIQPSQLSCLGGSVVEQLPHKQYVCRGFESHPSSFFSSSMGKEMSMFVVLPCFVYVYVHMYVRMYV